MLKKIIPPIVILGFGVEGKAAYELLKTQGFSDITVCDQNIEAELPVGCQSKLGEKAFENLEKFKTIIRSPGIHYKLPGILEAKEKGVTITSMTEMTLEIRRKRLTAITGSNGKTTTTAMIAAILKSHYNDQIIVGGNDGVPVVQETMKKPDQPILMEVSSFQFADLKLSPHISAVLNISPNHMDWHENLEDYVNAKKNLVAHQEKDDWCVLNANNEDSAKLAEHAPGQVFWIGERKGKYWCQWEDEKLVCQWNEKILDVLDKKDLVVKTHPDNVAFAIAIGLIHGVKPDMIKDSLSNFKGVEHRLEFVKEVDGIQFYNDSACTTPESVSVAIGQFEKGKLVLLLGGSSKKADFSFMAQHIVENKVRVYLYGEEGPSIQNAIQEEGGSNLILALDQTGDFEHIIKNAKSASKPSDSIVLSPACASFDMFKNSKERGKKFKEIVLRI